jgi:putative flavoprotein involved in K+ transport
MYAKIADLNYWTKTVRKRVSRDEAAKEWTVVFGRDRQEVTLRPKQSMLATAMSDKTNMPKCSGMERFNGCQHPLSKNSGPDAYKSKRALAIRSNHLPTFSTCRT